MPRIPPCVLLHGFIGMADISAFFALVSVVTSISDVPDQRAMPGEGLHAIFDWAVESGPGGEFAPLEFCWLFASRGWFPVEGWGPIRHFSLGIMHLSLEFGFPPPVIASSWMSDSAWEEFGDCL